MFELIVVAAVVSVFAVGLIWAVRGARRDKNTKNTNGS